MLQDGYNCRVDVIDDFVYSLDIILKSEKTHELTKLEAVRVPELFKKLKCENFLIRIY